MRPALLLLACLLVPCVAVADPTATCPTDTRDDLTRWLASSPHVPMAVSTDDRVATAGQPCCAPWATLGQTWQAIDAWGQITGTAEVTAAALYDVTRCEELTLEMKTGAAGVEVFVSGNDWKPRTSAERTATEDEVAHLMTFLDARDRELRAAVLIPTVTFPNPKPLDANQRVFDTDDVRHFQWTEAESTRRCAAVGGGALVVACLDDDDQWQEVFTDAETLPAARHNGGVRILSIVHVDGDAVPEIVIYKDWSDAWQNDIVGFDPTLDRWTTRAESIDGAHI